MKLLAATFALCGLVACTRPAITRESLGRELKPNETLVSFNREALRGLDREVVRARVLDRDTKRVREIVRESDGREGKSFVELREEERKARRAKFGAGGEGFDREMSARPAQDGLFSVQFVEGGDYAADVRQIAGLGATVRATFRNMASISARASVAAKIAHLASVEAIVAEQPKRNLALLMARDLEEAPLVPKHAAGFGTNLLAAIWEIDACVNRKHPDFRQVQWQPRFDDSCNTGGGQIPFHSTMVTDVFAAFRSDGTAGLYRGRIFDVNDSLLAATEDMWARQPQIVNASFTISAFDGKRIDTEVYKRRSLHVFNGAGNILTNGETTTCYAYNALCVGGYVDSDTVGAFQDDKAGPSSWRNLFGRETPQVVGPYVARKAATTSFTGTPPVYQTVEGTSFATPAVAGLGALLIANYPFDLTAQPEAVRAVLMASALVHPIVSDGLTVPNANDLIDDKVGVGAPNGARAKQIMDDHTMRYGSFLPLITSQPGLGQVSFSTPGNQRIRVVLTWDQCPDYVIGSPDLSTDLDLVVEAPSDFSLPGRPGRQFLSNISHHDNWEVVEFTLRRAGTVMVHVSVPVFKACSMAANPNVVNYGLAWTAVSSVPILTQ